MNYTKQQIRSAILRAADRIEKSPRSLVHVNCLSREYTSGRGGCLLVHVGMELGMPLPFDASRVAISCGMGHGVNDNSLLHFVHDLDVRNDGRLAAPQLRAYADKYFPAEHKPSRTDLVPIADFNRWLDSVRNGMRVEEVP